MAIDRERPAAPKQWSEMRCLSCRRLLAKVHRDALPAGVDVAEIKCHDCKRMNYVNRETTAAA